MRTRHGRMNLMTAVVALALIGLLATPGAALDPLVKDQCEKTVEKSDKKVGKVKEKVRGILTEFLDLKVACQAGTVDPATCDKKINKLILTVEKQTEGLDKQIEKFFVATSDKLPECGDELGELGVDDFNLF